MDKILLTVKSALLANWLSNPLTPRMLPGTNAPVGGTLYMDWTQDGVTTDPHDELESTASNRRLAEMLLECGRGAVNSGERTRGLAKLIK